MVGFYLPPLRDQRDLIVPLANKFLTELAARNRPDVSGASPEVLNALRGYSWPGNIRELRNVIERAVALSPGPEVQLLDLPEVMRQPGVNDDDVGIALPKVLKPSNQTLAQSREEAEILRIKEALDKHKNNRLRAAGELGISRMGLYKKLHKYGLTESQPSCRGAAT